MKKTETFRKREARRRRNIVEKVDEEEVKVDIESVSLEFNGKLKGLESFVETTFFSLDENFKVVDMNDQVFENIRRWEEQNGMNAPKKSKQEILGESWLSFVKGKEREEFLRIVSALNAGKIVYHVVDIDNINESQCKSKDHRKMLTVFVKKGRRYLIISFNLTKAFEEAERRKVPLKVPNRKMGILDELHVVEGKGATLRINIQEMFLPSSYGQAHNLDGQTGGGKGSNSKQVPRAFSSSHNLMLSKAKDLSSFDYRQDKDVKVPLHSGNGHHNAFLGEGRVKMSVKEAGKGSSKEELREARNLIKEKKAAKEVFESSGVERELNFSEEVQFDEISEKGLEKTASSEVRGEKSVEAGIATTKPSPKLGELEETNIAKAVKRFEGGEVRKRIKVSKERLRRAKQGPKDSREEGIKADEILLPFTLKIELVRRWKAKGLA